MKIIAKMGLSFLLLLSIIPIQGLNAASGEGEPSDYARNLIHNGTFDIPPTPPRAIEGWDTWPAEDTFAVVESPLQPGNQVLKIHSDDIPLQWRISEAHQWVEGVLPGQLFTISADVYFHEFVDAMVTVRIDFYDATKAFISYNYADLYEPNDEFKKLEFKGSVPEGASYAKVELDLKAMEANAHGTAYFDNIQMKYIWAPAHLRVSAKTDTSIGLVWDKPQYGDEYLYDVYDGEGTLIEGAGNISTTSFVMKGLPPTTSTYSFYVVAKPVEQPSWVSMPSNLLYTTTAKPEGTITILPIGDSLTAGVYPPRYLPGGYRGYLWERLQNNHSNVSFIGSLDSNPVNLDLFDPDHEGHVGAITSQIRTLMNNQVVPYEPDIVLLHAGTNDMWNPKNSAAANMATMLEELTTSLPDSYVIVASIPGIYDNAEGILPRIDTYNSALRGIVQQLRQAGKKVGFVDMSKRMDAQYFLEPGGDRMHPTAAGYSIMADVWYDAIDAVISTGDVSEMIPHEPALNVALNANNTSVQLSWQGASDNVGIHHYDIYQNDVKITSVTDAVYSDVTGLAPSTTYSFSVDAVDKAGNHSLRSNSVVVNTFAFPDLSPPTTPMELTAANITHDSVTLSWLPSTDDVGIYGYEVSYGESTISVTDAVYGNDNKPTSIITGLNPKTSYSFQVKAVDHFGKKSEQSESYSAVTLAAPPTELRVTGKLSTSLTLEWTPPTGSGDVAGYRIYVNDSLSVTVTNPYHSFTGLIPGQTYSFKVSAIDSHGNETLPTNMLKQLMVLLPPTGLAVTDSTLRSIDVRWSKVDGVTGYHVYLNGNLVTKTNSTNYQATGLTPDTEYLFAVQAIYNDEQQSAISDPIQAKTEKIPDSPSGGGGMPPVIAVDLREYIKSDKGIKLRFVPNVEQAIKSLNGAEGRLVFGIPSDKPFDSLELELSGEVLKLAADKQKPIVIQMGNLTLELPPGWLNAKDTDSMKLLIATRSLAKDGAATSQSLNPRSFAYDFKVELNGTIVTTYTHPVAVKIATGSKLDIDRSGVYLMDETKGSWTYQRGAVGESGDVSLELQHFSEYAVFQGFMTFDDISVHWARNEIESLAAKQIVNGLTKQRFGPSDKITRVEFAVMLARAFKLTDSSGELPFDDVSTQAWYHNEVKAAYQAGWIEGVSETKFAPNDRITREQMAVMVMKAYLHASNNSLNQVDQADGLAFTDVTDISDWALKYVSFASKLELIQGVNGSFKPGQYADRAQAAVMISRLLQKID